MTNKYKSIIEKVEKILFSDCKRREKPNDTLITTLVLLCMVIGYGTLATFGILAML